MKAEIRKSLKHQQGLTFVTIAILLAFMAVILVIVLKIAPTYANNMAVRNAVEGTMASNDVDDMTIGSFRSEVMKTIYVNGIRDFDSRSIVYTREDSRDYIDVNYELRVHLFYNIDAVVSFENRFDR